MEKPRNRIYTNLLDDNGKFARREYLENKFHVDLPTLLFNGLISAIPVMGNDKMAKLSDITTKDVYWELLEKKIKRPISDEKWQIETGFNCDEHHWGEININPYSLTTDTKVLRVLTLRLCIASWHANITC